MVTPKRNATSNMSPAEMMFANKNKNCFGLVVTHTKKNRVTIGQITKPSHLMLETGCFWSCNRRVNVFGMLVGSWKGLNNLFTWYEVEIGKISVILINCVKDISKTRLGKKFKWKCCMTYSKYQFHKVL